MAIFRKKPTKVEAVQWVGSNLKEVLEFMSLNHIEPQLVDFYKDGDLQIPILDGIIIAHLDDWIVKTSSGVFYPYKPLVFKDTFEPVEQSNLVDHAKHELELIGEDEWMTEGILNVVRAFAEMGHSGGSAYASIPMINDLLMFKNLSSLTDNPDEWIFHDEGTWGGEGGVWQNNRNSEAFSHDGGKTYYLLSEGGNDKKPEPRHVSKPYEKVEN